ncbi:hypothetical protein Micbo1qcDRAFT_180441 [Microdochium bolleyi]|uniref:Uncharacterized protein n=1 Tax=Microdochium bolleyi TaxID=196109 RepID=A0A136IM89_9PEZI|nr:hypothetical protein Micbo1qcDRAFT_180441 [Microdochium bolleyi]
MAFSLKTTLAVVLSAAAAVRGHPKCGGSCAADDCFAKASLPAEYLPTLSSFCYEYLSTSAGAVTQTTSAIATAIVTETTTLTLTGTGTDIMTATELTTTTPGADPATITNTQTTIATETTIIGTVCTTTSTISSFPTRVYYRVRGSDPASPPGKRNADVAIPPELSRGCKPGSLKAKVSAACSCVLATAHSTTTTVTVTATATATTAATATGSATATEILSTTVTSVETAPTAPPATASATQTITMILTSQPCTSTVTTTTFAADVTLSCGVPNPTVGHIGTITCPDVSAPRETNARFRIEGGSEGNVFDGCIASGPANITTLSGGTHLCDGTNNNANPASGGTLTTQIDAAGRLEGFGYDGTYSNQFQDFFINSISATTSSGNQFWGVLRNLVFTARGGCQEQTSSSDEGLWAFDAFAPNRVFLQLNPEYQVVRSGETASVTLTVLQANPNSGNLAPAAGATLGTGTIADANGNIQLVVPTEPGCYQYKAEKSNAIRSNAFYLTVMPPADD